MATFSCILITGATGFVDTRLKQRSPTTEAGFSRCINGCGLNNKLG